jgi:hypothetical protein
MKRLIFLFLLFFSVSLVFASPVKAVVETAGDLEVTYDSPLFNPAIIWYPGLSQTNDLLVKNIGSETHTTYFKAENTSETGNLSTAMYFKVSQGGSELYGSGGSKTMRNFWNDAEVSLLAVNSGQSTSYDLTLSFWQGAGNEFQNTEASFDLIIGFEGTEDEVVISVDTGDGGDGDGGDGTGGGDGGGDGGGASPSPASQAILGFVPFSFPRLRGVTEGAAAEGPAVAGVEAGPEPQIKGEAVCPWWSYLWWLPLLIQAALTYGYYSWLKDKKINFWWGIPLILAALSQISHEILGCTCIKSRLCPWYWVFNFSILGVLTFHYKRRQNQSSDLNGA